MPLKIAHCSTSSSALEIYENSQGATLHVCITLLITLRYDQSTSGEGHKNASIIKTIYVNGILKKCCVYGYGNSIVLYYFLLLLFELFEVLDDDDGDDGGRGGGRTAIVSAQFVVSQKVNSSPIMKSMVSSTILSQLSVKES